MKNKGGRPRKYTEVEIMQQRINKYFKQCDEKKEPYTITGLCIALDITRETLKEYLKKETFSDTIKKSKLRVENYLEKHLITDGSTTGIIFNLKNNFGWSDKQQIEHSGNVNNPFEGLSTEELRKILNE
ncbi:MAG: hypothetical protein HFJ34_04855 [Clostridia bacterium]|nr:hypothetical protein [Clostridia bacterium]